MEIFIRFVDLPNVDGKDPLLLLAYVNIALIYEKLHKYESALQTYNNVNILSLFNRIFRFWINFQELYQQRSFRVRFKR